METGYPGDPLVRILGIVVPKTELDRSGINKNWRDLGRKGKKRAGKGGGAIGGDGDADADTVIQMRIAFTFADLCSGIQDDGEGKLAKGKGKGKA